VVPEDREPFAALNADARVMKFMPALLPRPRATRSRARPRRISQPTASGRGRSRCPESPRSSLRRPRRTAFDAHFTPAIEIGWRLARALGQGYATEAALASARHAFAVAGANELVSFTTPQNVRSRAVMRRIA